MNNKYKELLSDTRIFALSNFASKILLFLLVPFYTYKLSSSEFGIVELVIALSNIIIPLASFGIYEAVFRYSFDSNFSSDDILCSFCQVFFLSCLIIGIGSSFFIAQYGRLLPLLFFFLSVSTLLHTAYSLFIKARGSTKLFAIDSVLYSVALVVMNILLLAIFNLGIIGYLSSILIANLISISFLMCFGKAPKFRISLRINSKLPKMLSYSIPLIFNSIAWMIISYSDRFMVNFFLSASAVGLYSVASKIPSLLTTIFNIFNQAWSISAIKQFETNTMSKSFYASVFSSYNLLIIFSANSLLWIIKSFMKIYVSPEYYIAHVYVPILLLGGCFLGVVNFFGSILASGKDSKNVMLSSLFGSLMNISLNFILIPKFGIMGAVFATAISYFAIAIYRFFVSRSIIRFDIKIYEMFFSYLLVSFQAILLSLQKDSIITFLLITIILVLINFKEIRKIGLLILTKKSL